MPASENNESRKIAVWAELLYLLNLTFLPVISFMILLWLYFKRQSDHTELAVSHLQQTISASIWSGILLIAVNLAIIILGGYSGPYTIILVLIYFTMAHSILILMGVWGLSKASAGLCWRYPLIGRPLPEGH